MNLEFKKKKEDFLSEISKLNGVKFVRAIQDETAASFEFESESNLIWITIDDENFYVTSMKKVKSGMIQKDRGRTVKKASTAVKEVKALIF